MSKLFLPTMREVPADANVISHQLMLRAGLIRKVASGIYTYLPLGLRVVKKISAIIEEEMDKSGAQEILMPMVQPAELWLESGRYQEYGPELLRFKDRKDSWFCLGPTHEEVVTALVRDHVKSYKSLPLNLYQIQTKFRDEIRPRFGLMRGREFLMKDAYSFCADKSSQDLIYQAMWDAYHRIFERCGLRFKAVSAATGSIGGDMSHEFQVLAQSGEDAIAACDACGYAANVELAKIGYQEGRDTAQNSSSYEKIATPQAKTIAEVASFLGVDATKLIKSVVFEIDGQLVLALVRGDQEVSPDKLKRALAAEMVAAASEERIAQEIGPVGFIGPIGPKQKVRIVADLGVQGLSNVVVGANGKDEHFQHVDMNRDVSAEFFDIREAKFGDPCGECGKPFSVLRGIEVGHIFYLGKKYSKALSATVQNEHGETTFMEIGCYGIGVSRTAAAAIEQNHDEKGIIWPKAIAPYQIHLVTLGAGQDLMTLADSLYEVLTRSGFEVIYDDRDERAGVKLNDADLIGCPLRITLGSRGLKNQEIEVVSRAAQEAGPHMVSLTSDYVTKIKNLFDLCP